MMSQQPIELTLTADEFERLGEVITTVLHNHESDDLGLVTLRIDFEHGEPDATITVYEYDEGDTEGVPLARYEECSLTPREDQPPLQRINLGGLAKKYGDDEDPKASDQQVS